MELLLLRVPIGSDTLETARAIVEGMRHQTQLDVVVARELTVVENPGVGVDRGLLAHRLRISVHAHLGPSVIARPAGGLSAVTCTACPHSAMNRASEPVWHH